MNSCNGIVDGNIIDANWASWGGGGLVGTHGRVSNNMIAGNEAVFFGGGLNSCYNKIYNNTIVANYAPCGGGLGWCLNTTVMIVNCVIWNNSAQTGDQLYQCDTPTYSCIEGWSGGGEGNTAGDPLFVGDPYDGWTWTHDASYDSGTFQSILTDITAEPYWEPGQLAGMFINPDISQPLQFFIVENTDTTVTVWGDAEGIDGVRDSYEIYDYHPQSGSPCIDAGDTTVDSGQNDLDGNPRYLSLWDGKIKAIDVNPDQSITLRWKLIDMIDIGAYEYQHNNLFTVIRRPALGSGSWESVFTGRAATWTDTGSIGVKKMFYQVFTQ